MTPMDVLDLPVMLAKSYSSEDPSGWMVSEKLDGVRAIWDGAGHLYTRKGHQIHAPEWFTDHLPTGLIIDGELWTGRGQFQKVVGIVRKKVPVDAEWGQVKFMVFDALRGGKFQVDPFAVRYQYLLEIAVFLDPFVEVVPHEYCLGREHLNQMYQKALGLGAEGLMMRDPVAPHESKRSKYLLKYKPMETDEAEVIGYEEGAGRNEGRVGALKVIWKRKVFGIGTGLSDELRTRPPQVGELVTFQYMGLTDDGFPRFPVFVGVRDYE